VLGPLNEGEHEYVAEVPRQEPQHTHAHGRMERTAHLVSQDTLPMRGMPILRLGQREQNLPFVRLPAFGQPPVHRSLLPLIRQYAAPPPHRGRRQVGHG
jgi:hypothetical protein